MGEISMMTLFMIVVISMDVFCLIIASVLVFKSYIEAKERKDMFNRIMSKDYRDYTLGELDIMKIKGKQPEKDKNKLNSNINI
jgi:hypothetical protein